MSIQRKFLIYTSAVIGVLALIIAVITVFKTSSDVSSQINEQKKNTADRLVNILTVTDSIMLERVKSSMALLKQRGEALGTPRLGETVFVKDTQANQLFLGDTPQANAFSLVDGLTDIMGGTATLFSKTGSDFIRVIQLISS